MTSGVRHRAYSRSRPRRAALTPGRWGWWAGVLAAALTVAAWSFASAPESAPDDQYHLSSIWCAHGDDADLCAYVPGDDFLRMLPAYATATGTCFAGKPADSAVCQKELLDDTEADTGTVAGNWWGHGYPPVFYWVLGWLASTHFELSIIAMRLLASLSVVGLVAWLAALVPRRQLPAAVTPLVVLTVPLGLFLITSTNPSGWTIGSAAVVVPALNAAFHTRGARQLQLGVVALLGAVMGAGARADACLFTAMAVVVVALLNWSRLRARPLATGVAMVCLGLSVVLFLGSGQSSAVSAGFNPTQITQESAGSGWFELTLNNLANLPTLWTGVLASGSMGSTGSLDTGFPAGVGFLLVGAVTILLYASWRRPERRVLLPLALVAASLVVYPVYLLGRSGLPVGAGIQPRYLLPLLVMLVGLVLLNGGARLSRRTALVVAAALSVGHAVALHVQLRRYISGLDVSGLSLESHREWWWDSAPPPDLVWALGSLAYAVLAVVALRLCVATPGPDWEDEGSAPSTAGDATT
jgi:hypothetical protein